MVFITANLLGTMEPCGCSQAMRGGIAKIAKIVDDARASGAPVLLLDSGNSLFAQPAISLEERPQAMAKAHALAQAWHSMQLSLRAPGPSDDALGDEFRKGLKLPELSIGTWKMLQVGALHLGIVAAKDLAQARALSAKARRANSDFVIALVNSSLPELLKTAAPGSGIDLAVAAAQPEFSDGDRLVEAPLRIARLSTQGRSLFRINLTLATPGPFLWEASDSERAKAVALLDQRIALNRAALDAPDLSAESRSVRATQLNQLIERRAALAAQNQEAAPARGGLASAGFVPIESQITDAPTVKRIVEHANASIGEANLAWAKAHGVDCPTPTDGSPRVLGSEVCTTCHASAAVAWVASKHHRAYPDLVAAKKQFALDCISCHVTGWQQPGGVCRIDKTAGREQVGCESCHGAGSLHVSTAGKAPLQRVTSDTCVRCHDDQNSPNFNYEKYLEQIRVPGHALP